MSISDAALLGLTEAQRMTEEDENASEMYGMSHPLCVPRILPRSAGKREQRTWEELVEINNQIRAAYLEMKGKGGGNVKTPDTD